MVSSRLADHVGAHRVRNRPARDLGHGRRVALGEWMTNAMALRPYTEALSAEQKERFTSHGNKGDAKPTAYWPWSGRINRDGVGESTHRSFADQIH